MLRIFMEITSDIILNNRKTIQVERDGEILNIEIPKEYIPKMLKGKGQIDHRIPFGPFIVATLEKNLPAKTAGVHISDQVIGIDDKKFNYFDEFQKYVQKTRTIPGNLNIFRKGDTNKYYCETDMLPGYLA